MDHKAMDITGIDARLIDCRIGDWVVPNRQTLYSRNGELIISGRHATTHIAGGRGSIRLRP